MRTFLSQLEQYTVDHPRDLWVVHAIVTEMDPDTNTTIEVEDEVLVFRGFSSSLVRPTAADPGTPVLPDDAVIQRLDRLESPYNPADPKYIVQGLSVAQVEALWAS